MKSTPASTTPATTKPPPSAAVGRAPKGTSIDEIKGLDDYEFDYDDDMENEGTGGGPSQPQEPPKDENPKMSTLIHSTTHQVMCLLNIEVITIPTIILPLRHHSRTASRVGSSC